MAARFDAIARAFDLPTADLTGMLVAWVVEVDAALRRAALYGLSYWCTKEGFTDAIVLAGLKTLPADVRPTEFMWPADRPFPWTADECRVAVIGHEVRWRGMTDDLPARLPARHSKRRL